MVTRTEIVQALALIDEPEMPVDGDCLKLQPRITQALRERGWPADLMTVVGWVDSANRIIGFVHEATECDGWAIDFTARQFNDNIPARWIIPTDRYPKLFASMTLVEKVTIGWETVESR